LGPFWGGFSNKKISYFLGEDNFLKAKKN